MAKRKKGVEYHIKEWKRLRNSPEVLAYLDSRAKAIRDAAGEGFTRWEARKGSARGRASVRTGSWAAMRAQSKDNILQRAISAGYDNPRG